MSSDAAVAVAQGLLEQGAQAAHSRCLQPLHQAAPPPGTLHSCPCRSPAPPSEFGTCLGDLYSVAWMENADETDLTLGAPRGSALRPLWVPGGLRAWVLGVSPATLADANLAAESQPASHP